MLKNLSRSQRGQAMPLVVACLLVLTMGAFAAMQFGVLTGGSLQVRNAVDAGALAIAARATDVPVPPSAAYSDVANSSGQITLTNINRVIGKAFLINLNAQSMQNSGQSGQSQGNAAQALNGANNISQNLVAALTDGEFLNTTFNQMGTSGGASGGGSGAQSGNQKGSKKGTPHFGTGFVHGGQTSNLSANNSQFPPGTNLNVNGMLPGYTQLMANGQPFYFVPFKQGEKSHLISTDEFNSGASPPANWQAPVPNAFQAQGNIGPNVGLNSVASAVTNPQVNYQLSIPHAFVDIQFPQTNVTWQVNGKQAGANTTYGTTQTTQNGIQNYKLGCKSKLNGYASLGNEYKGGTVLAAINGVPGTQAHQQALIDLTQRLAEIMPGFTLNQLTTLLSNQQLQPNTTDYILYPVYTTADNTNPQIVISPKSSVKAGWFNPGATPDGTAKSLGSETLQDSPNSSWGQVIGAWQLQTHHVTVNGQVMWTPGTGYDQNLGVIQFNRTAQVTFTGQCP